MQVLSKPGVLDGTGLPEAVAPPTHFLGSASGASRRALRRAVVVLALSPLTVLLATRLHNLTIDPVLGLYAVVMLATLSSVIYLAFVRYSDPSHDPPVEYGQPLVSCLVAVKNERDLIERCLESLLRSSYPNLEVIAVDDGSDDGTTETMRRIAAVEPRLQVLYNAESVGKKRALVRGVAEARGAFFVFTDSDCVMGHDAIERVMAAFAAHPDIGAVAGHARALNAEESLLTRMQDVWYDGQFAIWKASESVYGAVSCVSGPLAAFRREAIFNYLPAWASDSFLGSEFRFATDRQLTGYVLGAPYIGERLKRDHADSPFVRDENHPVRRWRVEYVRSARVDTLVPSRFRKFAKQQVRWKKSFIRNLFFTGAFYWRKGGVPAFLFYSHVMFILAMPLMAARHLVYMPLQGAYALTAVYLLGVFVKGSIWGLAYRAQNPGCSRWVYRPAMSVMTALLFSTLILYSAVTLRRGVWAR
jgi:cellulose synthase/poly-beta-1,6-N-acetylglucosamine synthase-like glycosyltransferase